MEKWSILVKSRNGLGSEKKTLILPQDMGGVVVVEWSYRAFQKRDSEERITCS